MSSDDLAVIFDLDGLLADTEPLWIASARELLQRRGLAEDPQLRPRVMGRPPKVVAAIYVEHFGLDEEPGDLMEERLAILRQLYGERGVDPLPGAVPLVRQLCASGLPLAVASGSPTELVELVLSKIQLAGAFSAVVGSDQGGRGKPAPDIFLNAAARLGWIPDRCVVLEDSALGIIAALAAKMGCIACPSAETPTDVATRAHRVVSALTEVDLEMMFAVSREARRRRRG